MPKKLNPIIFMHLPKTAGITLNSILNRNYLFTTGDIYCAPTPDNFKGLAALSQSSRNCLKMIQGHLHFGAHKYLSKPVNYVTLLREPVSRLLSQYNFIRIRKPHALHNQLIQNNYSLREVLEKGYVQSMDNCYVRYLCGISDIPYGGITKEHMEAALYNLEKYFPVVGITEQFDASVLLMAKIYGWRMPWYTKVNVNKRHKTNISVLDDETLDMAKYYCRYDEEVYNKALFLFQKHVQEMGPDFKAEVINFTKRNKEREFLTKVGTWIVYYIHRYMKKPIIGPRTV